LFSLRAGPFFERDPLKPGLVLNPEEYRWSSAAAHVSGLNDVVLSPETWLDPSERTAYAEFAPSRDDPADDAIRKATRT
jgi:putative transposase